MVLASQGYVAAAPRTHEERTTTYPVSDYGSAGQGKSPASLMRSWKAESSALDRGRAHRGCGPFERWLHRACSRRCHTECRAQPSRVATASRRRQVLRLRWCVRSESHPRGRPHPELRSEGTVCRAYGAERFALHRRPAGKVAVPMRVYAAENDDLTRVRYHGERLVRTLPQAECVVLVQVAGHFCFVASFPMALKIIAGEGAREPDGFDRDALHEAMNREIVGLFNLTLRPAGNAPTRSAQPPSCRSPE